MSLNGLRDGLAQNLDADLQSLRTADNYYRGKQPLRFLSDDVRRMSENRLQNVSVNWPRLVVDSIAERLYVEGFRTDAGPDAGLWDLWQRSGMDDKSSQAHLDALIFGRSFVMVWADGMGRPRISVESPLQIMVEVDPVSGEVIAALKRWTNSAGYGRALLFTPEKVAHFRTKHPYPQQPGRQPIETASTTMDSGPGLWDQFMVEDNVLGVVPVVPLVNRSRVLLPLGESELADVMSLTDAVNKLVTDMMVSAEFSAMPRRWVTGLTSVSGNPTSEQTRSTKEQVEQFWEGARKSKVWIANGPDVRLGQFPEASLDSYTSAVRMLTTQVAAIAGLPPHYLGLVADNAASADAIRSAEASLVKKAYLRQRSWGEAWEQVMRLAVHVRDGVAPMALDGIETIWRSPETRTVAQAADAATKLYAAGIFDRQAALEEMDVTPETITRLTQFTGVIA